MKIGKEMLKGYVDIIILSSLYCEDLYGYELARRVKLRTDGNFELKEGTLYLALKRLEQAGLIEAYWGAENSGGRRKYYRLLPDGWRDLSKRKREWVLLKDIIDLFMSDVETDG